MPQIAIFISFVSISRWIILSCKSNIIISVSMLGEGDATLLINSILAQFLWISLKSYIIFFHNLSKSLLSILYHNDPSFLETFRYVSEHYMDNIHCSNTGVTNPFGATNHFVGYCWVSESQNFVSCFVWAVVKLFRGPKKFFCGPDIVRHLCSNQKTIHSLSGEVHAAHGMKKTFVPIYFFFV